MKCKGIDKRETRRHSKTIYCNTELHPHQIFCHVCGHPTAALKTDLSARQNLKDTLKNRKNENSRHLMLGVVLSLFFYISAAIIIFFTLDNYLLTNLVLLITVPVLLVPFAQKGDLTFTTFKKVFFKFYPVYWVFVLMAEIYFFLLKVICAGYLLDIMIDPVLHIVRLIMVIYGIVCALPAILLIGEQKMCPFKALIVAIKSGYETRWQQFFTIFYVFVINAVGILALLAGLLVSLPLSYQLIRNYYLRMVDYELFISPNPRLETRTKASL